MSLKQEVNRILRDIENPDGGGTMVSFSEKPWYNEEESEKLGRPIFENRVYITKHKDNLSINIERADEYDFKNYQRQYEAFERDRKDKEEGIPIGMLPGITPTQRSTCEACKVFTIERLAQADKILMSTLRFPELQERALEYLQKDDKVEDLQEEIAALKKQLAEKSNVPSNNGTKRRRRNTAVRTTPVDNNQQQQRSTPVS